MVKKTSLRSGRPSDAPQPHPEELDDFVKQAPEKTVMAEPTPTEPVERPKMKRLTLDLPPDLHSRLKAKVALKGSKMLDVVREMIQRYVDET